MMKDNIGGIPLDLSGAPNFRDLGGVVTGNGQVLAKNKIFRSERLSELTLLDLEVVDGLDIGLVIDLRSEYERRQHPGKLSLSKHIKHVNIEIITDVRAANRNTFKPLWEKPDAEGADAVMRNIYRAMPLIFAPHFKALIQKIIYYKAPLVLHCTVGKDRTGFLSALILHSLGVERDIYMSDYLETRKRVEIDRWYSSIDMLLTERLGYKPAPEVIHTILGVKEVYLESAFGVILDGFGSVEGYLLEACKISDEELGSFKEYLLS